MDLAAPVAATVVALVHRASRLWIVVKALQALICPPIWFPNHAMKADDDEFGMNFG